MPAGAVALPGSGMISLILGFSRALAILLYEQAV
jgi:hypothetical protein